MAKTIRNKTKPKLPNGKRWASKAACEEYFYKHEPKGLTRCAAEDFVGKKLTK